MAAYAIPPNYLRALLLGLRDDLTGRPIATFADLERYSFRVASTVGLGDVPSWEPPRHALAAAAALGIAMQLTNILRDVADDLDRGRLYLPPMSWSVSAAPSALALGAVDDCLRGLLRFQIERARRYYAPGDWAGRAHARGTLPDSPRRDAAWTYPRQDRDPGLQRILAPAMVGRREKVTLAGRVAFGLQLQRIGGAVPRRPARRISWIPRRRWARPRSRN